MIPVNNNQKVKISVKGFIDEDIDENINMIEEIQKLKKEKNAVILAHYYQIPDIQNIADYIGDSLALSQVAEKTQASIILFAGVHFMAETAKILNPEKKVLIPDIHAGCSLADSCPVDQFEKFVKEHPNHTVISYVNTSVEVKALSDIICTSGNAVKIVKSLPKHERIIFAPDKNLGNYINSLTGRKMVLWDGSCYVHEDFSLEKIIQLKEKYPEAKIIAHPECRKQILMIADFIGSTAALLRYTQKDKADIYIVATEWGIIHQMTKANPDKKFIPAPPVDSTCGCSECKFMKMITIKKLYLCLKYEMPEVIIDEEIRKKAYKPIKRMLEISEKIGL